MHLKKLSKGFTLIELLVVVGIIVILAALIIVNITEARMNGRDAKRIADVASIQLALEMYKDKTGHYPDITGWAVDAGTAEKANWVQLGTDLKNYLDPLPKDPTNKNGYYYYVYIFQDTSPMPISTGAIIKTKLEADVNVARMADDSCTTVTDYYDIKTGIVPSGVDPCTIAIPTF